jgi:hypothetical protein
MSTPNRKPRKTTTGRGYGTAHRQRRANLAPLVAAGLVNCARCGERIQPGALWDLGHVDGNRNQWSGPQHRHCNRQTEWHGTKKPREGEHMLRWSRAWFWPIPAKVENREALIQAEETKTLD